MKRQCWLVFSVILFGILAPSASAAEKRPNVLFLITDDQRADTIAALGNSVIKTPNLDKLVQRGFVFRHAYCMGSTVGAVCNPSRHMILSGKALYHYKAKDAKGTMGEVFRRMAYFTYLISKRGNTATAYHSAFEIFGYLDDAKERNSGHHGRAAAEKTIHFLKNTWNKERPFFAYVGFEGPHDPRVAAPEWLNLYDRAKIPVPKNYQPLHPFNNGELLIRDEALAPWPRTEEVVRKHLHDYYACISSLDHQIGRILAALQELGELDNTIIIFTSDHGLAIGSHGLFGKQSLYEHSMKAPLIFAGPGIPRGQSDALAYLFDIYPTAVELVGGKSPAGLDGKSLAPVMRGTQKAVRDTLFLAYRDVQRAVRQDDWKLIRYPKVDITQLFNLRDDPDELKNLAGDPAQTKKVREMMELLAQQQALFHDRAPLVVANPLPSKVEESFFKKAKPKKTSLGGQISGGARPPNIIILLSDDQGWGDLSITGNKTLKTPNIDSLALRGAKFDRFYVQPVCSPTRAEMLTGRYHPRTGVRGVSTGQERMNLGEITIAQLLRARGYRTGLIGKWHNGSQWPYHPNARGFEEFYGFTSGHWGEYFDPPLEHNGKPVRGKGYIADDFTAKAIAFIEKHRSEPFLCYVAYNTPHSPFCVPDEDWNQFKDRPIEQRGTDGKKEDLAVTRCVLAMCANLDRNVGRILQKLEELDIADNTIVIFFSDNGPNSVRWNGGMRGIKASTDEGGVRSPCFIRWPGKITPGTVIPQIAGAIDLLPTLASLTKAPLPKEKLLDGRDLSPLLLGKKIDWPERMLFSTIAGKVSVRTQQYRLDANGRLYDMLADPGQTMDVAQERPEVARKLRQAVVDWRAEVFAGKKHDRPFPVGFKEFPMTPLPARDGIAHGGIRRSAGAPNCSYFTNWKSKDDAITWDIEVNTPGLYRAEIHYTCAAQDTGAAVELRFKDSKSTGKVTQAWDPVLLDKQDRVPRKAESYMKEFRTLALEPMVLEKGRGNLTLRALEIPGQKVMDVRAVTLLLIENR